MTRRRWKQLWRWLRHPLKQLEERQHRLHSCDFCWDELSSNLWYTCRACDVRFHVSCVYPASMLRQGRESDYMVDTVVHFVRMTSRRPHKEPIWTGYAYVCELCYADEVL